MSGLSIHVITVSDTRTPATDSSGRMLFDRLSEGGHRVSGPEIIPDDLAGIRSTLQRCVAAPEIDVVVLTGGTGITRRDVTPEALAPLVTKSIPGFGELFRMLSYAEIGASTIQSRAAAALCDGTLVFALPGSTNAVRLALEKIILPQLDAKTKPCNFVELLPRIRA
ncbi:MAG TPA: molybdenum cofactor synthesis domain-containing protein [Polyangiaceae bacterium]|nr:molybdenum cofactor synthesis domain-containing protein [Polyangiaceae bacterium]